MPLPEYIQKLFVSGPGPFITSLCSSLKEQVSETRTETILTIITAHEIYQNSYTDWLHCKHCWFHEILPIWFSPLKSAFYLHGSILHLQPKALFATLSIFKWQASSWTHIFPLTSVRGFLLRCGIFKLNKLSGAVSRLCACMYVRMDGWMCVS